VVAIIQTMKAILPVDATAERLDTNATNLQWNLVYATVESVRDGLVAHFSRLQDFLYLGFVIPKVVPNLTSHLR